MLHSNIHHQRADNGLHNVCKPEWQQHDLVPVACPKCGSDEDYDYYLEWGTVDHYHCQCSCGYEWHTIGLYK